MSILFLTYTKEFTKLKCIGYIAISVSAFKEMMGIVRS